MRLIETLQEFSKVIPYFVEVVEKGALCLRRYENEGAVRFAYRQVELTPVAGKVMVKLAGSLADRVELYCIAKMVMEGVKLFRPSQEQLDMLEQMTLNVEFPDYVQPFPTVVVEFPSEYLRNKVVHCPQNGQWFYGGRIAQVHEPSYIIVRHEPTIGCILTSLMFTSKLSIKTAIVPRSGDTLESYIEGFTDKDKFENTLEVTAEEWAIVKQCIRAALNYCLLLDEIGIRHAGPQNERQYRRLQHFVEAGRRRGDPPQRQAQARVDLLTHPQLYELKQNVRLHRVVRHDHELPETPGPTKPPHHRRGHYRFQRFGVGLRQKKRIRIPPVFVNAHLFLGKMSNTSTTYVDER